MLDYYVVTTCTDKPISEVEREFRRETALQNLLLWAGGNVQDPRRTARPEKLEAEAFWGAGRVAALVSRGCKQEQGQAFVLVRYPRRGSAERGQAVSPDGLWAELCALWGSSDCWPDLAASAPWPWLFLLSVSLKTREASETSVCASTPRRQVQEAAAAAAAARGRGAARTPRSRSGHKDIFSHFEISETN